MNTTESEDGSVGPLREALTVCAAAGMSGILRVTGDPGGAIHIADGLVAAQLPQGGQSFLPGALPRVPAETAIGRAQQQMPRLSFHASSPFLHIQSRQDAGPSL